VSDLDLFAAGVSITFLFLGGVYVVAREGFLHGREDDDGDEQ
jgi:hypothetical protein